MKRQHFFCLCIFVFIAFAGVSYSKKSQSVQEDNEFAEFEDFDDGS